MYLARKRINIPSLLQPHFHHLGPQGEASAWGVPAARAVLGAWTPARGHPRACEPTPGPFLHNVGMKGQLAFLQPSAVSLGDLEKISDVQQSLADVVPKALGICL